MYKKQNPKTKNNLSQFGLLDIPGSLEDEEMDSDSDMDLEAELAAITGGSRSATRKPKKSPANIPGSNLESMIAESLKDVPSDEDVSGDDDDPDLLSELKELTVEDEEAPAPPPRSSRPAPAPPSATNSTTSLLQERIAMYTSAEKNAKAKGESSRARRFNRGLKTLNDLLKQAKAGKSITEEDIPPVLSVGNPPASAPEFDHPLAEDYVASQDPLGVEEPSAPMEPPPPPPDPIPVETVPTATPIDSEIQKGLVIILKRKEEFKAAALACKHAGDKSMALEYLKVAKQFDIVVDAYKNGQEMDLSELPTVEAIAASFNSAQKTENHVQQSNADQDPSSLAPSAPEDSALITASSVEEGLQQHLSYYKEQHDKAKESGNGAKMRRMARIVKQFEQAIKLQALGRPIPVAELPPPPGYAPLPISGGTPTPAPPRSAPAVRPASEPKPQVSMTRADKQIFFLVHRQREFKEAALNAKKNGDISQAKEYLRCAKGFDSMIDAAKGGLVVDLKSLPLPPQAKQQLEDAFDVISVEDCGPSTTTDADDVLTTLHQQLNTQLKLCLTNRDHYEAMGNVAETNRFEHLAVTVKQDLDVVTIARRLGQEPPKFHYESRQFSIVQCNSDLNENDLELTIVRGIAYNVPNPKDVDTYVKFEFPYPQETPATDRTGLVKDTNSPVYNSTFPLVINRSARPCLRVFKRHGIKFEVYSRGGWFARDTLLGSFVVKLAPLESAVTIHEAFPLMEGRRPAGGSVEVKLRVRTPLLQQQFEQSTHRWLVMDN